MSRTKPSQGTVACMAHVVSVHPMRDRWGMIAVVHAATRLNGACHGATGVATGCAAPLGSAPILPFACSSAHTSVVRQSSHKAEAAASAQTATLFDEKPLWRELLSGLVLGMFQAV